MGRSWTEDDRELFYAVENGERESPYVCDSCGCVLAVGRHNNGHDLCKKCEDAEENFQCQECFQNLPKASTTIHYVRGGDKICHSCFLEMEEERRQERELRRSYF
jgi:hypothetical protein